MIVALLPLLAQAAVPPAVDPCPGSGPDIVICGSRPGESPYRMPRLPERYDPKKIRAETNVIAGVHARAHVDAVDMPDGNRSNRLMVTIGIPF